MVFREKLDNPMSKLVAKAVGATFCLRNRVSGASTSCLKNYSHILRSTWRFHGSEMVWPYRTCSIRQCKLNAHVYCGNEKGIGKVETRGREHPFVIDGEYGSKEEPVRA